MSELTENDLSGRSRIVSNVVISWFAYLVFFAAGFVLPHLIDENLGRDMLGIWDYSWSLVNYLSLTALGIGSSLNRYVAKYRAEGSSAKIQQAASTVVVIQLILALLLMLATSVISILVPATLSVDAAMQETLKNVFLLLGLSLAVEFLFDTSRGVLQGYHRWDLFNAIDAGGYFIAVCVMGFLLISGYGLLELSFTYLMMKFFQGIIRNITARSICPESRFKLGSVSVQFAKEIVVFGGKSILINIAPTVVIQTTYIIVMTTAGPAALAVMARSVSLIRNVENFFARFTFILTPMAGSLDVLQSTSGVRSFAVESVKFAYAFSLPILLAFCLFAAFIIEIWMGPDYVDHALIATLGIGYLLPMAQSPMIRVLIGIDQHGRAAIISTAGTILAYLSVLLIVFSVDLPAEEALLIVIPLSIVQGILIPLFACRKIQLPVITYLKDCFLTTTLLNVVAAIPLIYCTVYLELTGPKSLIGLAAYGAVLLPLYWKLLLPKELKRTILGPARKLVIQAMYISGLNGFILSRLKNSVPILTLHGVGNPNPADEWQPTWARYPTDALEHALGVLKQHFTFISMDDAVAMLDGRIPLKTNCIVLTFDDGYLNNITEALPVLEKLDIPFNLYVTTGVMAAQQPFWVDRIDFALQQLNEEQYTLRSPLIEQTINLYSVSEAGRSYKEFRDVTRQSYQDDYQMIQDMEELAANLEISSGRSLLELSKGEKWSAVVQPQDLEKLPDTAVIGSHTVSHARVDHIDKDSLKKELIESKAELEYITGKPCDHFCYPQGYYDDATARMTKDCGYLSASTGRQGTNYIGCDVFKLKRIAFPESGSPAEIQYGVIRGLFAR